MYLGLVLSGIFATIDPSRLVTEQVPPIVPVLWAVGMALSATCCLIGSLTDMWIGEYTGIPLLGAVLGLYGVSAVLAAGPGNLILTAYGCVVLSFAFGLGARWTDVRSIKQNATAESSRKGGE